MNPDSNFGVRELSAAEKLFSILDGISRGKYKKDNSTGINFFYFLKDLISLDPECSLPISAQVIDLIYNKEIYDLKEIAEFIYIRYVLTTTTAEIKQVQIKKEGDGNWVELLIIPGINSGTHYIINYLVNAKVVRTEHEDVPKTAYVQKFENIYEIEKYVREKLNNLIEKYSVSPNPSQKEYE